MKVVVISGGASPEHEVSLASGQGIAIAATTLGHDVVPLVIDAEGNWQDGQHEAIALMQDADVVVPALHGEGGEDGVIQGFLQQLAIRYVGSGVGASAVGLDKHLTKAVLRAHDIQVTPGITLRGEELRDPESAMQQLEAAGLDFPVFVKPGSGGSSFGVTRATDLPSLATALAEAAALDPNVLVEQEMRGREIDLAVMAFPRRPGRGGARAGDPPGPGPAVLQRDRQVRQRGHPLRRTGTAGEHAGRATPAYCG